LLTELIYSLKTWADGTVSLFDIPEGKYLFNISAPGHSPYSGTFSIQPGMTTTVPIALEINMVNIEWSVVPITIEDRYEIKITQTFETNVPAPVLITEPPSITLPIMQPGQVFNGEFSITNYGLIAVYNVRMQSPTSFLGYDIEILSSAIPKRINAMEKITVPYRITRRQTVAALGLSSPDGQGEGAVYTCNSLPRPQGEGRGEGGVDSGPSPYATLFDEVQGYGGGGCVTSFTVSTCGDATICPNSANQRETTKCTSYTIAVPIDCPSGGGGGGTGGGGYVYTGGGSGQGGGGTVPGGSPGILPTQSCACMNCDDRNPCTTDGCTSGACWHEPINCDDGNPCTDDSCGANGCVHVPKNCDDGNACTTDSCVAGSCEHSSPNQKR
jgi:hypothetical protein